MIAPLLDAGLDLDAIRVLVFRLAFDTIVGVATPTLTDLAGDQSPDVQAAWRLTIGRMIIGDASAG
jgi:hypothetical protein